MGWLLVVWLLMSVVLAAMHHRLRRLQPAVPPEVEEFLIRFETTLLRRHPQVGFRGLLPGSLCALLSVRGQEVKVDLSETMRRSQAFPDAFDVTVDRLLGEVEEAGLDHIVEHEFPAVAAAILPQIRPRAWLQDAGRFGDGALVHRTLNDELVVVYVIDRDEQVVFVCNAHLRVWQKTEADLFGLAVANLHRRGLPAPATPQSLVEPMIVRTGDGYDAARVLLLQEGAEGLLVAMPDRDVLWVGQEQGQDLAGLMANTADLNRRAAHPVSPSLYRVRAGRLEPVGG